MSSIKPIPFEATAIESIPSTVNLCQTTFHVQKTKPLSYRLMQLRKLYWGINDNADALVEACKQDLGKPTFEASLAEVDWCKNDIVFVSKNLKKWMKDEPAPDIPLTYSFMNPRIRKETSRYSPRYWSIQLPRSTLVWSLHWCYCSWLHCCLEAI